MANNQKKEIFREYDKLLLVLAVVFTLLLVFVYFFAEKILTFIGLNRPDAVSFIQSLITEFLPIGVTFLISYKLFTRIQEFKNQDFINDVTDAIIKKIEHSHLSNATFKMTDFRDIKWVDLLKDAEKVDVTVHFFDTWIRYNDKFFEDIFNRGGTVRCVLPNAENKSIVKLITNRFPEYNEKEIKTKISHTKEKLTMIKNRSGKGSLKIYEVDELGYYCGIQIDERVFVLSNYDHIRNNMKIEGITFVIDISENKGVSNWFQKEFEGLIEKSIKTQTF